MKKAITILPLLCLFFSQSQTSKKLSASLSFSDAVNILASQFDAQFVHVTSAKEVTYSSKIDDDEGQFSSIYEGTILLPGAIENSVVSDFAITPSRSYLALFAETSAFEKAKEKYGELCKLISAIKINDQKLIGNAEVIEPDQPNIATRFDLSHQDGDKEFSVAVILIKNKKEQYKVFIGIGNGFSLETWVNNF